MPAEGARCCAELQDGVLSACRAALGIAGTRCSWELLRGTCKMCPCWPHWGCWDEAIFNQKILIAELFLNALLTFLLPTFVGLMPQ